MIWGRFIIVHRANRENGCTARFREERLKSQALLNEAAVVAFLAYAELNPVRVKIAETPEGSEHTSIKKRIETAKTGRQSKSFMRFAGNPTKNMPKGLLKYYLEGVDLTCRFKRGFVTDAQPFLADLIFNLKIG